MTTTSWVALLAFLLVFGSSADKVSARDTARPAATAAQPAVGAAPVAPPVTVVEYYNRMVALDRGNEFPCSITKTPGGWRCSGPFGDDPDRNYPCVVDIPNAFLSIEDEGTGGGTSILQIALFKKANGEIILALNRREKDSEMLVANTSRLPTFYAYRDGAFTTITKRVMPDTVTGDAFAAAPGTADSIGMYYDLPRHGTDITAAVNPGFAEICKKSESERGAMFVPEMLANVNRRCKTYNGLARTSVALHFDKQTGQFKLPK